MNYHSGSKESLELHQALANCNNRELFKTEFIDNLILFKWKKLKKYSYLYLFAQFLFNSFIIAHIYLPGELWPFVLLLILAFLFFILEIFTYFASNQSFTHCRIGNFMIFILLVVYSIITLNNPNQYANYILPTINLLSWKESTIQL